MLKVATWNVNSINSRLERAVKFLERHQPNILCLQELKCIDEKFPLEAFTQIGYTCTVFGQKTYNGVAVISREKPDEVVRGFDDEVDDPASRFLTVRFGDLWVSSAYIPNGKEVGSESYTYKLNWLKRLRHFLDARFTAKDKVLVAGDFNVAPENRDVHDPASWAGKILFSEPEKKSLSEVCEFGLADTFRLHHEDRGQYSWWDYRQLSFPFNKGLRIDFILVTEALAKVCVSAEIDRDERKGDKPSDHAPVLADFDFST